MYAITPIIIFNQKKKVADYQQVAVHTWANN